MRKAAAASLWMGTCSATAVTCSGSVPDSPLPTTSELRSPLLPSPPLTNSSGQRAPLRPAEARNALPGQAEESSGEGPKGQRPKDMTFQMDCGQGAFQLPRWGDWLSFHVRSLCCGLSSGVHGQVPVLSKGLTHVCISSISQAVFWLWIIGRGHREHSSLFCTPHVGQIRGQRVLTTVSYLCIWMKR